MSNPRDTQFQNFAKLLVDDLPEPPTDDSVLGAHAEWREQVELIIAQRAHDLVYHSCVAINNTQVEQTGMSLHPNAMMRAIPDMTEWTMED